MPNTERTPIPSYMRRLAWPLTASMSLHQRVLVMRQWLPELGVSGMRPKPSSRGEFLVAVRSQLEQGKGG